MDGTVSEEIAQERTDAGELWHAIMFASSPLQLQRAQQKLKESPLCIQLAVMHAIISRWQLNHIPTPDENPFNSDNDGRS